MARKPKTINDIYREILKEEQRLLLIHLEHYRNIALNLYEWENLPEGMEGRHIEQALLFHGQCFFYDHDSLGFICLPCSNTGQLNVYGEPKSVMITGHGKNKTKHISIDISSKTNRSKEIAFSLKAMKMFNLNAEIKETICKKMNLSLEIDILF